MRFCKFMLGACLSFGLAIGEVAQAATIYAAGYSTDELYKIDTQLHTVTTVGAFGIDFTEGDLAFDSGGVLYGAFAGTLDQLASVNSGTGPATLIGPFNPSNVTDISAMSFRPTDGLLFALDSDANKLVTINTTTGLSSLFGTGDISGLVDIANVTGMAFDPGDADTLYMAQAGSTSLYKIQGLAGTPTATIVGDLGLNRVTGMTFALDGSQLKLFVINSTSSGSQLYSVDPSLLLPPVLVAVNGLPADLGGIAAAVPEPGALSLLVAGVAGVVLRRARAAIRTR